MTHRKIRIDAPPVEKSERFLPSDHIEQLGISMMSSEPPHTLRMEFHQRLMGDLGGQSHSTPVPSPR